MPWQIFTGSGRPAGPEPAVLPDPPPWKERDAAIGKFVIGPELLNAVNVALHLRRPLLLTGAPGSGKSTLVSLVANELQLGEPLSWHITSRSVLTDALYQYDALGRLHATQTDAATGGAEVRVDDFVTLGPLGTALASADRPRAVLIDEIDKSDFDLPGDLLNILEQGEFDIPVLARAARLRGRDDSREIVHRVRGADRRVYEVANGLVRRSHWPVIVLTSNGERPFPAPFLRRCVRFEMPVPDESLIHEVVLRYLDKVADRESAKIHEFAQRVLEGQTLALDQLLNFLYLVSGENAPDEQVRAIVERILLEELRSR